MMPSAFGPIQWPPGIDETVFLDQIWQKKPLLIRQAFPDFRTPLPADELAGLSVDADTTGRIITRDDNGSYTLEYGPFDEDRFDTLTGNQWSLLVTDVDKHIPEFAAYLQPFRFIPDWRIDDLMISYAPDGASVGAHVDEYDVFLLQGSGIRTWRIDAREDTEHQLRTDGELQLLANFQPSDQWDLSAGDMLYLPPGMAHHGIAKGDDCTTWSIGFRAPRIADFLARVAELLSEQMPPQQRYADGPMKPSRQGEISAQSIQRFKAVWDKVTTLDDAAFATLLGSWLTESTTLAPANNDAASTTEQVSRLVNNQVNNQVNSQCALGLHKAPFSRFSWIEQSADTATLFADGAALSCSLHFAMTLSASAHRIDIVPAQLAKTDIACLHKLIDLGCLLPVAV